MAIWFLQEPMSFSAPLLFTETQQYIQILINSNLSDFYQKTPLREVRTPMFRFPLDLETVLGKSKFLFVIHIHILFGTSLVDAEICASFHYMNFLKHPLEILKVKEFASIKNNKVL